MQLSPRYTGPPVIDVDAVVGDPGVALVRQQARFAAALADLTDDEWHAPSRCSEWTAQDVAEHLAGVNRFWIHSIAAGRSREPTTLLASFDPVAVPAAMVEAVRGDPPPVTLERFTTSSGELARLLADLTGEDWSALAEAPPGHLALRAVVAHALWDSWIHERDVLLPLARPTSIEEDEVRASLVYAAALGHALRLAAGSTSTGALAVVAHHPDLRFTVDIGAEVTVHPGARSEATATLEGEAVQLLEAFSVRAPFPQVPEPHRWLLGGLDSAFGQ